MCADVADVGMTCLRVLFSFHAVCGKTRTVCNCRFGCDRILEPGVEIIQYVIDVFTYWEVRLILLGPAENEKTPTNRGF